MNAPGALHPLDRSAAAPDPRRSGSAIALGTGALIVLAPVPNGCQAPWCQAALFAAACVLVALWLGAALRAGSLHWSRSAAWPVLAAGLGLLALQCIPLPGAVVAGLSPEAALTHDSALPGAAQRVATLSVAPHATESGLFRLLAIAAVFVVTAQALTRRRQVVVVLIAVLVAAATQLVIGGLRLATDPARVLWNTPTSVSQTLAGTFLDASHLAALLAAALGVVMGLWMAACGTRRSGLLRPLLLATGVTLGFGIALTRSHAGLLAALATVFVFLLTIGIAARLRLRTLGLFGAIALVLCVGQFIALELVLGWLEETAPTSVAAVGWSDRADLHRSAWTLFATYPLVGSGLGTFAAVFPRFQSARFGDLLAEHPHNDWMTLACETGVVGLLVAALLLGLVVVPALRRGLARTDSGLRWLTAGALVGAVALLAQSGFDAAVLRVPAFGVIFAALLGAGFAAARMPGRDTGEPAAVAAPPVWRVPLGPAPLRLGLALVVPFALALAAWVPVRRGVADVIVNRGLARWGEPTDRHHFLPLPAASGAMAAPVAEARRSFSEGGANGKWLERAQRLDPRNPRLARLAARALERRIESAVSARAEKYARAHLCSLGASGSDPAALTAALRPGVRREVLAERAADTALLGAALDRAVRLAPTSAEYRLARARFRLVAGRSRLQREAAGRDASAAMTLAPSRPAVLFRAGLVLVDLASSPDGSGAAAAPGRLAMAAGGFRRALAARPAIADDVYDLLLDANGSPRSLFAATPVTAPAYGRLVDRLIAERAWPEALSALDGLDRLGAPPTGSRLPQPATFTDHRRALVYERLGDWRRRAAAVARYRTRKAAALTPHVARADCAAAAGRRPAALLAYREVLAVDRTHPGALLGLARLAQEAPDVRRVAPPPLGLLERLVRCAHDPTPVQLAEVGARARREAARDPQRADRARHVASLARRRASCPVAPAPASTCPRGFAPAAVDFSAAVTLVGFRLTAPTDADGPLRLVTVWEGGPEPRSDAAVVVEVLGGRNRVLERVTRPLRAEDGGLVRDGGRITCTIDLASCGGGGLRLAVYARSDDSQERVALPTDVDEPWLTLRTRPLE